MASITDSTWSTAILAAAIKRTSHLHLLGDLAAIALSVGRLEPILVGQFEFAQETNQLVAAVALFRLQRDLSTHHATGLLAELSLEFVRKSTRVEAHEGLRLRKATLAEDAVHLVIGLDKVVPIYN